jgi:hypothetical protein
VRLAVVDRRPPDDLPALGGELAELQQPGLGLVGDTGRDQRGQQQEPATDESAQRQLHGRCPDASPASGGVRRRAVVCLGLHDDFIALAQAPVGLLLRLAAALVAPLGSTASRTSASAGCRAAAAA